jgi:hypothetical protein
MLNVTQWAARWLPGVVRQHLRTWLPRPRPTRRPTSSAPATEPAWTYDADGLKTWHNADFLNDPRFRRAYAAGAATGSWYGGDVAWRAYVACWAAERAVRMQGDFVECGVYRGGLARTVADYVDFANLTDRRFFLLDTFHGFPPEQLHAVPKVHHAHYQEDCYDDVRRTFAEFPNVVLIRGTIPDTLPCIVSRRIAFLSIDLNCAAPEIAALEYCWDKLVPGAVVLFDDYGYSEHYRRQKEACDEFAWQKGTPILSLPTGQGMIVKV